MSLSMHEKLALIDKLHKEPTLYLDPLLTIIRAFRGSGDSKYTSIMSSLNEAKQLIEAMGLKAIYNHTAGRWELITNTDEFIDAREA